MQSGSGDGVVIDESEVVAAMDKYQLRQRAGTRTGDLRRDIERVVDKRDEHGVVDLC